MKKWMKVSCATLSLVTLAACGNLSGKSNSKDSDGNTILMYQIGDAPKNIDVLMKNANKIIEKKLNVKLNIKYISWGDYKEKMAIITSSGEKYDIAFADNYVVNAQKGAYADLTELYKKEGKDLYSQLDPAYIKGNMINGKIYAVPVIGNVASQQMLSFNEDMLKKYNLDISNIKSYEDLAPFLSIIKEKEPGVTPFAFTKSSHVSDTFSYPAGNELPFAIDLSEDTSKVINPFEVDHFKEHLRTIHDYYQKGYIAADAATSDATYDLAKKTWFVREETQGPADFGDSLLSTVAGYGIVSKPITKAYKTNGSTQVANFVISKNSKNKSKAMEVLNLLNTNKELLNGLVFGPEDTNWEKDSSRGEDFIKLLKGYANDTRMSAWNTGNSKILYITDKVSDNDIKNAKKQIETAEEDPTLGFNFNTEPVKTEISSVQNTMKQYLSNIFTGTVDPDKTIDEMMAKLNSEGSYKKIKEEMQKQYDEFLSKK